MQLLSAKFNCNRTSDSEEVKNVKKFTDIKADGRTP